MARAAATTFRARAGSRRAITLAWLASAVGSSDESWNGRKHSIAVRLCLVAAASSPRRSLMIPR
jgi:hypothetical protein